jgi:hypothetical protein
MLPLALGIAIPGEHTRLARLETDAPFLAALGAAVSCCIFPIIHPEEIRDSPHSRLYALKFQKVILSKDIKASS